MAQDLESVAGALRNGAPLCDDSLHLALGGGTLRLRSNSAQLIAGLRDYFDHVACAPAEPDLDVVAIEREAPEIGLEFIDWKRGPGKSGRKGVVYISKFSRLGLNSRFGPPQVRPTQVGR